MYINPQSEFILYTGIPFDREHKHVRLFTGVGSQSAYFNGKIVRRFNEFSYVRKDKSVKIPVVADDVLNCNYCSFMNAGFGSKRFYAFITNIEYTANRTTTISIEVDWVQTFITEWKIGRCYVEREHVADDTIGKHTVEENLEVGEYVVVNESTYSAGYGLMAFISDADGRIVNNVYSSASVFTSRDAPTMNGWLAGYDETPEKIVMVCMCSAGMVGGLEPTQKSTTLTFTRTRGAFQFGGDSYVPKNNKLYSYPYRFITIDNYNGNTEILRWENCNAEAASNISFQVNEVPYPKPFMEIYPLDYNGVHSASGMGVSYDNFPQCAYQVDTFKAWISQALPQAVVSTGSTAMVGVLAGGAVGAAIGLVSGATNFALDYRQKKLHSETMGGSIGSSGGNFAQNRIGFRIQEHSVKPEYARIIDEFFTRFGYKVDRYKVPNTTGHEGFNYVKCVESVCEGNVPQECIEQVESMLNRGVTLHHTDF